VDANQPPSALDGYFGAVPPAAPQELSPLDAAWTADALTAPAAAEPAMSFTAPAPTYDLPVVPVGAPVPPAPQAVPAQAYPLETPAPVAAAAATVPGIQPPAAVPTQAAEPPAVAPRNAPEPTKISLSSVASLLTPATPVYEDAVDEVAPEGASDASEAPAAERLDPGVRLGAEDSSMEATFLTDLLIETLDRGCSDLHLTVGAPPTVRLNGHLTPMEDRARLVPQALQKVLYAIMSQKQREKFEEELELDFAYSVPGRARFRVNIYRQRDSIGAAFRLIPYEIRPLEALGVPPSVANFAMLPRGFVLVTGPTGSGKSTTLAAIVDLANRNRRDHIMTVEDPIEFLHEHKSCLVNQREVGEDTHNFKNALKHVLRQDPDIILVGEMRDLETIEIALTAAETGHLVMATLHTQDAAQTIDRVIDVFPPHQQQQVRVQLAGAIQGVVCQQLLRTADGKGRVVATEVLVATPAIRNLIREGKTHQIYSAMQAGAKHGMATMDQHLAELVKKGKVSYDAALEKCHHVEDFQRLCGRV
jgi:twitching motility protein PilT